MDAARDFISRKIKEIEGNWERFLDRAEQYHNEATTKLASVESDPNISELQSLREQLEIWRRKLDVQKAREARTQQGSNLEYGLSHFMGGFIRELKKGPPNQANAPDKDETWLNDMKKNKEKLEIWYEKFKSTFTGIAEAADTFKECDDCFELYRTVITPLVDVILIKCWRNKRRADGSVLEYGLDYHLRGFKSALATGPPKDPRFPQKDDEWMAERAKSKDLLVQWLETFKANFGQLAEAAATIEECEAALTEYKNVVEKVKVPLLILSLRGARRADGCCLEYGLEYHLRGFNSALEKGLPGDPRFPAKDNEWIEARGKDKELLIQWLEDFKSKAGEYEEATPTIEECEKALKLYKDVVDKVRVPLIIQNLRSARRADGCCLEYGLEYHLRGFNSNLEQGIPGDPRFPAKDNEWIEARGKEKVLLVQWLEDFKSKAGEYEEALPTIEECEKALKLYKDVVDKVRIPLLVQNLRNARRADNSCLEYGLEYHLRGFVGALEKGIPGDPRFPDRDNEWIDQRVKEKELLVQWLEDFKSKAGEYDEATPTIEECENALVLFKKVVDKVRIPLLVQNLRNARRANGSCLEYGLEYHLRGFNNALEKGMPGDPRFPNRDNEWLEEQTKSKELLVQWLEDFKTKAGEYDEATPTIEECEKALTLFKKVVGKVKGTLLVQNARNARRADGSVLEYGVEYHLRGFVGALEKGIPGDPRFPDRDNAWLDEQIKNKELLVQWLEDFKTKAGEYDEAIPTIEECENALILYKNVVDKIRIPLLVQNLRNARRADNSCLEYGLEYHLRGMKTALEKGIPGDPRFPDRDNDWINEQVKNKELLVQWLEEFKSKAGEYDEAVPTIEECENILELYKNVVDKVRVPLLVQNLRNARRADGSCLEYGLEYHLRGLDNALEKGIPGDPRFPERDNEWITEQTKGKELIVQWLEDFKSKVGEYDEAIPTIQQCENTLAKYKQVVEKVRVPLLIQNAKNARRADGSCLEYGLSYHLRGLNTALEKGIPGDPRFPQKDNEWVEERAKEKDLLVQWLEGFKSSCGEYEEALETIKECEDCLELYSSVVDKFRIPLLIQNARNARRADGSCLEYGLDYHLKAFKGQLEKGLPGDPRFPERDNEWIEARVKEKELLVEWLENFKSKLGEYSESSAIINECEDALELYKKVVDTIKIPLMVQNARNARTKEGSCLEYGLDYHLKAFKGQLEKGLPGDPRFPERDNEWIDAQSKSKELLVQWLEDFKSKFGEYEESWKTIEECESVLSLYKSIILPLKVPLEIQNARNARKKDGSVLEYGLDHHVKSLTRLLEKGLPGDPRFPERDNEWLDSCTKDKDLLIQWLETFKSKFAEYEQSQATIQECESVLEKYRSVVDPVRIPLLIQNAKNARKAQGSCLEYGLEYHLKGFTNAIEKGMPTDKRFPERSNQWLQERTKDKELLVQWLEDFKSKFGHYTQSAALIEQCENAIALYKSTVEKIKIPLEIENARNARKQQGSVLEYGFDYHIRQFSGLIEKGYPNDKSAKVNEEWIKTASKYKDLLVEWLEDFKSKFAEYPESQATIAEAEDNVARFQKIFVSVTIPFALQQAKEARLAQGSVLEYGLEYHLSGFDKLLKTGPPKDPRFPERDNEWLAKVTKAKELLVTWLEDFRSKFEIFPASEPIITECEKHLVSFEEVVNPIRIPLSIQNARNARKADGSVLHYGLDYHLKGFTRELNNGLPSDDRFPDRNFTWMDKRREEKELLVNWLEEFRAKFGEFKESIQTVEECEAALKLYQETVAKILVPLQIQKVLLVRDSHSRTLPNHIETLRSSLQKGVPGDPRFPERDEQYLQANIKDYNLLLERVEDFKSEFGEYEEALPTLEEANSVFDLYQTVIGKIAIPIAVQNERNARKAQGSVLEYGIDYHIKQLNSELALSFDSIDLEKAKKLYNLLVEWLENFKSKFMEQILTNEATVKATIEEAEKVLVHYKQVVGKYTVPIAVEKYRKDRSLLPYGLDYQLKGLDKVIEQDKDFGSIDQASKMYTQLVEWLENFKSEFQSFTTSDEVPSVKQTIEEVEIVLKKYNSIIVGARAQRDMKKAIDARTILPYGLTYQLQQLENETKSNSPNAKKVAGLLVIWLENFKSQFKYTEGAKEVIKSVEDALAKYSADHPREAAQLYTIAKENKAKSNSASSNSSSSTSSNITSGYESEEDEIPVAISTSSQKDLKEPLPAPPRVIRKEIPVSPLIDPSTVNRSTPAAFPFTAAVLEEVIKKQKTLSETVRKNILIGVDWSFTSNNSFSELSEENQKKACQALGYSILSRLVLSDTGLVGVCNSHKVVANIIVSRVSKIVLGYDGNNSISSPIVGNNGAGKEYSVVLDDSTLYITINLNAWNASFGEEFFLKIDPIFNLTLSKGIESLIVQSESIKNAFQKTIERKNIIGVHIDIDNFVDHPVFATLPLEQKVGVLEELVRITKLFLISSGGLSELCENSAIVKKEIFQYVRTIYVTFDPNNSVNSSVGKEKYYDVTLNSKEGVLSMVINFSSHSAKLKNLADLDQKIDSTFGLVALKALDASKTKLVAYQNIISRKIKTDVIVEVAWNRWISHKNFLAYDIATQQQVNHVILQTHLNEIINGESGFIESFNKNLSLQKIFARKLKKLVICYDPENSINIKNSESPYFRLYFDHYNCTLYVEGNLTSYKLESGKGWKDFKLKFQPILESASDRFNVDKYLRSRSRSVISSITESSSTVRVDWDSFIHREDFLTSSQLIRNKIISSFENIHTPNLINQLNDVAAHPLGRKALHNQVTKFVFTVKYGPNFPQDSIAHYQLDSESKEFLIPISFGNIHQANQILSWQIRWILGVSIDVAQDIGNQKMAVHLNTANSIIQKDIKLKFDWSFIEDKIFLSIPPKNVVTTIESLSDQLVNQVLHNGLVKVCTHPIGKQSIQENIDVVRIIYRHKTDNSQKDSDLRVSGKDLIIECCINTIQKSLVSRYKERIEFEYDLIVAIAKDNAVSTLKSIEEKLKDTVNTSIPIDVELESFTRVNTFRYKDPPEQSDIITTLFSHLPLQSIASDVVGLFAILQSPISVAPFVEKVNKIEFKVDANSTLNNPEGVVSIVDKVLVIHLDLNTTLFSPKLTNWKERILFVLDILVEVSIYETKSQFDEIQHSLDHSLTKSCPISIDWANFVRSNEFRSMNPTDQVKAVKTAQVIMLNKTLLGDSAFTGPKGLCEFVDTINHLNNQFSSIQFSIQPSGEIPFVNVNQNVLHIGYTLGDLVQENFKGCHENLETLLHLRPIKQAAAIKRAETKISTDCAIFEQKYCKISVIWNSFVDREQTSQYVQTINEIAEVPAKILMIAHNSFGNVGLLELASSSNSLSAALQKFEVIEITVDPDNNTTSKLGESRSLVPTCYVVSPHDRALNIRMNLKGRNSIPAVGRVVQFVLCQQEALAAEEKTRRAIAEDMRRHEQDRRDSEVRRANDRNKDIQNSNKRDQDDYKRAMDDYNKKMHEKCNYSQCSGGKLKCGVCAGRGHNTNNKITSTCSSCSGDGYRICCQCNGTQKKYPNGPSLPSQPRFRDPEPMPTFGSFPNFYNQI